MIHFIDKVLENLRSYIPLMQTIVWPVFIGILVCIFYKPLTACITAISKRIEKGSPVKAGPFELGELPKSTPQERIQKLNEEIEEVQQAPDAKSTAPANVTPTDSHEQSKHDIRAPYLLAKALVLNKISIELGVNIEREVWAGTEKQFMFDGVALVGQKFIAVEIKYIPGQVHPIRIARRALNQMKMFYDKLSGDARTAFSVILAVVIAKENLSPSDQIKQQLEDEKLQYSFPVEIKVYRMEDLESDA